MVFVSRSRTFRFVSSGSVIRMVTASNSGNTCRGLASWRSSVNVTETLVWPRFSFYNTAHA
jgi:hypothetical protein